MEMLIPNPLMQWRRLSKLKDIWLDAKTGYLVMGVGNIPDKIEKISFVEYVWRLRDEHQEHLNAEAAERHRFREWAVERTGTNEENRNG